MRITLRSRSRKPEPSVNWTSNPTKLPRPVALARVLVDVQQTKAGDLLHRCLCEELEVLGLDLNPKP